MSARGMGGSDERYPVEAPGWAGIDAVASARYPGQIPHQFTSSTAYDLESKSPLPAISVWEAPQPPHWHYITYGLTELFEKTSASAEISGFGYELTFRVPRQEDESRPPTWPLTLLQGIGSWVLSGHGALDSGHCIDLGGPLVPNLKTELVALLCVPDPTLGKFEGPFGTVLFLQLFGLTADELERVQTWDLRRKVGLVTDAFPLAVTDPARQSMREDERTAPIFRRYDLDIRL